MLTFSVMVNSIMVQYIQEVNKCNVHVKIQGFDEGIVCFIFYVFHRYVFNLNAFSSLVQNAIFAVSGVRV
jgi:hypothetical protein